ncbi:MAG: DUF5696 domain-containing protein [Oscillospiraceae bacterium]|nr:DUF5696 domain-containing protein [Oscillospiraceae bacterium]
MKLGTKIVLSLLGLAALVVLIWQGYITVRYRLHRDYLDILGGNSGGVEVGAPFSGTADANAPDGMVLAAQNSTLKLFINPLTTETAVLDTRTGVTTYSNPPDAASDGRAGGINKSLLQSPLVIEYYNARRLPGNANAFDDSIMLDQFEIESISNGVRVIYTIGDTSSPLGLIPLYISLERLEYFADKIVRGSENTTRQARTRLIGSYVESTDAPGFMELIESARTGQSTIRQINELLEEVGYTEEDLNADMEAANVEGSERVSFVVPLEYRLDDDSLVVSIPTSEIKENGGAKLARILLLRNFGAGGNEEEGYLVVPNGSGSLIRFNNGKSHADDYLQYIYGLDPLMAEYVQLGVIDVPRMPYFGIQREGQGIIAEIEVGDTLADVTARVAGKVDSYNYVYPSFTLRGTNSLAMFGSTGNEAEMPIVENEMANINITVRYSFLTDRHYGYAGMAAYLREKMLEDGTLTAKADTGGDIPFYMNLIGSVSGRKHFMSVAYVGQHTMTTFSQAGDIINELTAAGISNQIVNYQGWFNRGYYHDAADKVRLVGGLGSKREFERLATTLEAQGGKLYGDVAFQHVSWMTRRYEYDLESSRYYGGGMVGVLGVTCPTCMSNTWSMGYTEVLHNLISPKFLDTYVNGFIKNFDKYNITGISLRDMGSELHSDRKRTELINREEAKTIVLHHIENLAQTGNDLMFAGGNMYVVGYSDDLINVPIAHNSLYIVDEEIPFYNMILHGSLNYAGSPINLSDAYDEEELILRLLEFGASPNFVFTAEDSSNMKATGLNNVYGATFSDWKNTAVSIYNELNSVLSLVSNSFVTNHEILGGGLRRITYSNGIVIEIDWDNKTYQVKGA